MPRTKRDNLKRLIAQAHNSLGRAGSDLATLHTIFEPQHPKHAENLSAMITVIVSLQEAIDGFCDASWGGHPEDYDQWRDSKQRKEPAILDYTLCQGYPANCEQCAHAAICGAGADRDE